MIHVLMIGYEKDAVDVTSEAFRRIQGYVMPDLRIVTVALSGGASVDQSVEQGGLSAYLFSGTPLRRLYRAYKVSRGLIDAAPGAVLVSAQDPFMAGTFAWFLRLVTGIPYEIQEHGDFFTPAWIQGSILNRFWSKVGGMVLRRASRVRVVSERVAEHVRARGVPPERMLTLPVVQDLTSLHESSLRSRTPGQPFQFMMPCRWTHQKGLDVALKACHLLRQRTDVPPFRLTLIGRGELASALKNQIVQLDLVTTVELLPWMERDVLWKMADALVVASRWEGWCRTIPEAMAAGVNIITTPVGCVGSFFRPNQDGLVVPAEHPQALAEAMVFVLTHPDKCEAWRAAAKQRSQAFPTASVLRDAQRAAWHAMLS